MDWLQTSLTYGSDITSPQWSAPVAKRQDMGHAAHHVWACDSAYWLWRQRRGFNFIKTADTLALVPPAMRSKGRPASEEELSRFCLTFALKLERYGGEVSNVYSMLDLWDLTPPFEPSAGAKSNRQSTAYRPAAVLLPLLSDNRIYQTHQSERAGAHYTSIRRL